MEPTPNAGAVSDRAAGTEVESTDELDVVSQRVAEPDYSLALEEARRSFQGLERELPAMRDRATQLLSVAGLAASFLGGLSVAAEESIGPAGWVAVIAFLLTVGLTLYIMWPKRMVASTDAEVMIGWADHEGATLSNMQKALARALKRAQDTNRRKIDHLSYFYMAAHATLVVEILAFVVNLWSR